MTAKTIALAVLATAVVAAFALWCHGTRDVRAAIHLEPLPQRLALRLLAAPAPRVECRRSDRLRLIRFEDGSARLECARRLLVRVSVPG